MLFAAPCLEAARRFDAGRHRLFVMAGQVVGWVRDDDVALLNRWPHLFSFESNAVVLTDDLTTVEARSDALGDVIQRLADDGRITGWRDETFAIRNQFDDPPLALIERAASRFFGTMTYAVHANGLIAAADAKNLADADSLWISRRSANKAVDPGMLDTLMGGGIGWGWSIADAMIKECWEESGIPAELAAQATRGRTLHVLAEIEEGTQSEQLFVYDLMLPPSFVPSAQDGEVAEHLRVSAQAVLEEVRSGRMTVDASLSTLDCALRRGWIDAADVPEFTNIYTMPLPVKKASGGNY